MSITDPDDRSFPVRRSVRTPNRALHRSKLGVERLEDRCLLASAPLAGLSGAAELLSLPASFETTKAALRQAEPSGGGTNAHQQEGRIAGERAALSLHRAARRHRARRLPRHRPSTVPAPVPSPSPSATPLKVQFSFPSNGQVENGGASFIVVGFNQALNPASLNSSTVQLARRLPDGSFAPVPAAVLDNPGKDAVVIAPTAVQPNGQYQVTINGGVQGESGGSLAQPFTTSYTVNDGPPTVTVFSPGSGAQVANFTGVIVADQSKALDRTSITPDTARLVRLNSDGSETVIPATVHYDPEIPSVELAVSAALSRGNYRFELRGVRDLAGNLAAPFNGDFTITRDQVAPGPDVLPDTPISVVDTFPHEGQTTDVTPIVSLSFNQSALPASVNSKSVQLARVLPNGQFQVMPMSVTYNDALHSAYLISEQGLPEGNYVIAVNGGPDGVHDRLGRALTTQFFHYSLFSQDHPPVDGRVFTAFPSAGATVSGEPPAILVFFQKFAGELAGSVNSTTVQLHPVLGGGALGSPLPASVVYNPWPGNALLVPDLPLGDGTYAITVNGIVDIAGNVQRNAFSSTFQVTGTGRPQTVV